MSETNSRSQVIAYCIVNRGLQTENQTSNWSQLHEFLLKVAHLNMLLKLRLKDDSHPTLLCILCLC